MDIVNTLNNTLNRTTGGYVADPSSSSEAGGSKIKTASDVSGAILDIFKCSLLEVDSYLATYEVKLKLEEEYVKGLKLMNDKSKDSVVKLDARIAASMYIEPGGAQLPRARQTWKMIRDDYLKELDARLQYIDTLRQGVITPLTAYRDSQERIRKRVKEDLKMSIGRYDEMRNIIVPRARKQYEKKSDEVEQVRLQQQAVDDQRSLLSTPHVYMSREPSSHSANRDPSSPVLSSAPLEGEDDYEGQTSTMHSEVTSARRSLSFRRSRNPSQGRKISSGATDNGSKSISSPSSAGISPKLSGDAPLSTSPGVGEKKGHFLDALRSKDNWDAARKEAPKKLNALLNRMRDGGNEKADSGLGATSTHGEAGGMQGPGLGIALGGGPGSIKSSHNAALKNVRIKREAEEADQAYRKAVFDLETLRLRREKTVSAAITSVVEARRELYLTCQAVWLQAETASQTFANHLLGTSGHAIQAVQMSLETLEEELKRVESRVPSLADLDEDRVPYVNYYFGECKDLIFGVSLIDYAFSRAQHAPPLLGPSKIEAPLIVRKCIAFIEERALTQAGIYRVSAKHTAIQNLAHALERDEERFQFDPSQDEPAAVAGVLKLYLRQLPEAILPIPWEERIRYTHERQEQIQSGFAALKSRIRRLPAINQATLKLIVEHLARVASYSEQNKMTISNLSIVFGPLLLSQADHETTSIAAAMEEDRVTEDLILYCSDIFNLSHAGAPVLPPLNAASKMNDNDLHIPQPASEVGGPPVALTRSDSDTPIVSLLRTGSLHRSNAVVKGNIGGGEAAPRNDFRVIPADEAASTLNGMQHSLDHETSVQPFTSAPPPLIPPPTVPMYGDSVDEATHPYIATSHAES